ncbi:kanamycin nucleotidyltransferase C-terminal domain-containing protein [Oscillatoria sp. CS-180]|uniref:kanamycin nucleotidyltransferase C-terminal domain-containing protein n=1 Tax=Oscillatoria sp. CS-180 TaxID=3021720 RepID=UPI00232C9F47|nr:kanamycin nucleotidyltransferase C-terminal domain-containing protein [Oscillatoria sp. CS-180]MDB9526319.1 kanamycin nucleotidyltransferase C-terminal domain-containing protein [Oscillatoria sp. CS-180]
MNSGVKQINSKSWLEEFRKGMFLDPKPLPHSDRAQLAKQLVQRILAVRGEQVLAIGLYGSLARGTDQLYSDIEMKCVLSTQGEDYSQEWVEKGSKIEVNFESEDVILSEAATVDEDWAITHGAYFDLKPLYGDDEFFVRLKDTLRSPSQEDFTAAIQEIIVGNIFEAICKLRNALLESNTDYLPTLACEIAQQSALAIGLAHKKCYSTRSVILSESLEFKNRPDGHEQLCQIVMQSNFSDFDAIAETLETLWIGLVQWAEKNYFNLAKRCVAPL